MTKKKQKTKKLSRNQFIEKVLELLDNHIDTTRAILDDYLSGDDGMITELGAANENLRNSIEALEVEDDFKSLLEQIKKSDDFDCGELLKLIADEDEDFILNYSTNKGYALIKLETMEQRSKLEDFIKAEIYPYHNDENKFFI